MSDLISRQAAIDTIISQEAVYADDAIDVLRRFPSAEPEIIRCKDCKYYEWTGNRIPEEQTWWCYKYNTEMGNNDYCSYGEQRGGDGNG